MLLGAQPTADRGNCVKGTLGAAGMVEIVEFVIRAVSDAEISAYADGRLERHRRAKVAAYLEKHPEHADRVDAYRWQNRALRRIFSAPPAPEEELDRLAAEFDRCIARGQARRARRARGRDARRVRAG